MYARRWWTLVATLILLSGRAAMAEPTGAPDGASDAPSAAAPAEPLDAAPPLSPAVHVGRLSNGLTYYVQKHGAPEQRAAVWLAVDAGSVVERDDQRGFAHFVEHLAFEGTRRFPKQQVWTFLEKAGMRFGADVNAYTGFDRTVYELTVPTDDAKVVTKALDILRDIAGDIAFEPDAIDHERAVVLEEWRLRQRAGVRMKDLETAAFLGGSPYADRQPIGLPERIKGADRDALVRFYRDWYRPESMAVIAVGDFDVPAVEAAIRRRFADLATPATPPPARPATAVPHDGPPAVVFIPDPEARYTSIAICDRIDHRFEVTKRDYRANLVDRLLDTMESNRLADLRDNRVSPLVGSAVKRIKLTTATDARLRQVTVKEGQTVEALNLLFMEIPQAARRGFFAAELDRARGEAVTHIERFANEYDKTPLSGRASEIVRNFLEREPIPGPDVELDWTRELAATITLDEVNALARTRAAETGRIIAISAPTQEALPKEATVLAIARASATNPVELWHDVIPVGPLIATPPAPRPVVSTTHDAAADATVWVLANGVRVVVKPTTFLRDTISLVGWQAGGTSRVSDEDFPNARFAGEIVGGSSAGRLSPRQINRLVAGHRVSVSLGIGELGAEVRADTRPQDLEMMLQLLYLRLTASQNDGGAFRVWKARRLEQARHAADSPAQQFADAVAVLASGDHPRRRPITPAAVEAVDRGRAYAAWTEELANLSGFTFVLVGNVDLARLQPLVETYLGALPADGPHPGWRDVGVPYPPGKVERTIRAGREPVGEVWIGFAAPAQFSFDAERDARVLDAALRIRLRDVLRQKMAGVYHVYVLARLIREPAVRQELSIQFACAPENVDVLREAVFGALREIARGHVDRELLVKVAGQLRRQNELDLRSNAWWLARLREAYTHGEDFGQQNDVKALIARVTAANIQAAARRFVDENHYMLAVMRPVPDAPDANPPAPTAEPTEP